MVGWGFLTSLFHGGFDESALCVPDMCYGAEGRMLGWFSWRLAAVSLGDLIWWLLRLGAQVLLGWAAIIKDVMACHGHSKCSYGQCSCDMFGVGFSVLSLEGSWGEAFLEGYGVWGMLCDHLMWLIARTGLEGFVLACIGSLAMPNACGAGWDLVTGVLL
ncbi:hypothetical protein U1Q18_007652 [Sarracenia purpurea var. burkii]